MVKKFDSIFKKVLENIEPGKQELVELEELLRVFLKKLFIEIKKNNLDVEIFIGGSFAKKTMIKKNDYDADVFLRFSRKYKDNEISILTKSLIKNFGKITEIHGSRDYYQIKLNDSFFVELIPVIKVKNPKESENTTDLSYSHVKYINKKLKSKNILQEIKLAKAFCYANHCYGAESYIHGFSGYSLELLVYYYGSFLKFIKAMAKIKNNKTMAKIKNNKTMAKEENKEVIDIEKAYKNKKAVLMDLNHSKLNSPIILIDPTYKQRNTLAALSEETFSKFKENCKEFLKNPSEDFFELKKTDLEEIKKQAIKKKFEFILIEAKTEKQEGDIAGSKLLKFYNHFENELRRFFDIKNKGFNYNGKKSARYFFVLKKKKQILFKGPYVKDKKNLESFEKTHKTYHIKKGRVYAKELVKENSKEFFKKWKLKNKNRIKEMYISELKII